MASESIEKLLETNQNLEKHQDPPEKGDFIDDCENGVYEKLEFIDEKGDCPLMNHHDSQPESVDENSDKGPRPLMNKNSIDESKIYTGIGSPLMNLKKKESKKFQNRKNSGENLRAPKSDSSSSTNENGEEVRIKIDLKQREIDERIRNLIDYHSVVYAAYLKQWHYTMIKLASDLGYRLEKRFIIPKPLYYAMLQHKDHPVIKNVFNPDLHLTRPPVSPSLSPSLQYPPVNQNDPNIRVYCNFYNEMYSEISSLVQVTDADQIYHPIDLQLFLFWLAVDCYDEVVRMARKHKHVRIRHEFAGVENWNQQILFFRLFPLNSNDELPHAPPMLPFAFVVNIYAEPLDWALIQGPNGQPLLPPMLMNSQPQIEPLTNQMAQLNVQNIQEPSYNQQHNQSYRNPLVHQSLPSGNFGNAQNQNQQMYQNGLIPPLVQNGTGTSTHMVPNNDNAHSHTIPHGHGAHIVSSGHTQLVPTGRGHHSVSNAPNSYSQSAPNNTIGSVPSLMSANFAPPMYNITVHTQPQPTFMHSPPQLSTFISQQPQIEPLTTQMIHIQVDGQQHQQGNRSFRSSPNSQSSTQSMVYQPVGNNGGGIGLSGHNGGNGQVQQSHVHQQVQTRMSVPSIQPIRLPPNPHQNGRHNTQGSRHQQNHQVGQAPVNVHVQQQCHPFSHQLLQNPNLPRQPPQPLLSTVPNVPPTFHPNVNVLNGPSQFQQPHFIPPMLTSSHHQLPRPPPHHHAPHIEPLNTTIVPNPSKKQYANRLFAGFSNVPNVPNVPNVHCSGQSVFYHVQNGQNHEGQPIYNNNIHQQRW